MSTNPEPAPKPEEKTEVVWWHMMGIGLLFFVGAGFIYFYITSIEQQGGGRIHWLIALLYNIGGKWLCVGFVALFRVGFTLAGVVALAKKSKSAASDEDEEE